MLELADPRAMADPGKAFRENPKKRIALDLVHDAVGPMYGHAGRRGGDEARRAAVRARRTTSSTCTSPARSRSTARRSRSTGFGLRDHSWGPRYWQAIHAYRWLTLNFGAGPRRDGLDHPARSGGQAASGAAACSCAATRSSRSSTRRSRPTTTRTASTTTVSARTVKTAKGEELEIDGEVTGFIPLRNRREGRTTHIGEGMTRWRFGDRVGYGLSEFLKQVE